MLKTLKNNIDEFADLNKLCLFDSETSIDVSRYFVATLYDQMGKMKSAHDNLNRLRVKITKQKDVSLAKLPLCEASFVQHVLRASLQTYIRMKSDTAQPPEKSALDWLGRSKRIVTRLLCWSHFFRFSERFAVYM